MRSISSVESATDVVPGVDPQLGLGGRLIAAVVPVNPFSSPARALRSGPSDRGPRRPLPGSRHGSRGRAVADAARLGAILSRGRNRRDDRDMAVAREMRRDLGQAADVFRAVLGEKPRSPLRPARSVSPSSRIGEPPRRTAAAPARAPAWICRSRQAGEPDHRAVVAVARRALLGPQRRFHRHDIDRHAALAGIDAQHQPAAGNAAVDLDHQPPGARVVGIGVGRNRLRQRDVDLADMVAPDRRGADAGEFARIDGILDRNHGGAAFHRAEPHQDLVARRQRRIVQPEDARLQPPRVARRGADMRDHIAALEEQFAVERDADRTAGALRARHRRHRPAFDDLDLRDLARGHDDDFVAGFEAPDSTRPATMRRSSNL